MKTIYLVMVLSFTFSAVVFGKDSKTTSSENSEIKISRANDPVLHNDFALLSSDEYIYSNSKRFESLRTSPGTVSVITPTQLGSLSGRFIPQMLRLFPGIDVLQISRTEFSVSTRGFSNRSQFRPRDLLVLIDGRTVYDDFSGTVEWETFDIFPQDIAKIEVIRGAGSAVHGPNASRGVINILTNPPEVLPGFGLHTNIGKDALQQRISSAQSENGISWKFNTGFEKVELFDRFADAGPIVDDTGIKTWRGNAVVTKEISSNSELKLNIGTNTGDLAQTTSSGQLLQNDQTTNHVLIEYDSALYTIRTFWNHRKLESTDMFTGDLTSDRTQNLYDIEAVHRHINHGINYLTIGAGLRSIDVEAESLNGKANIFSGGIFFDDQVNITPKFQIQIASRLDYHEETDYQFSPRGGLAYEINPAHTIKTSVNIGYRNPTVADNFFDLTVTQGPFTSTILGNRDLDPERSIWYEAGYQGTPTQSLSFGIDLFHVVTEDFIRSTFIPPGTVTFSNSDSKVRGKGGEIWTQYKVHQNILVIGNYAYAVYKEDGIRNEATPKNKINFGVLVSEIRKISGALLVHFVDKTDWPFGGPPSPLTKEGSYYTVNLQIGYQITSNLSARAEIYNLTNNKHRELPLLGEELSTDAFFTINYQI